MDGIIAAIIGFFLSIGSFFQSGQLTATQSVNETATMTATLRVSQRNYSLENIENGLTIIWRHLYRFDLLW